VLTPKRYVELEVLPTAVGLAVLPRADDLRANVADEIVSIARPQGLALSTPAGAAPPLVQAQAPAGGPTLIDFGAWGRVEAPNSFAAIRMLRDAVARLPESSANNARLRLAQFLLSQELAPEALGEIQLLQAADPALRDNTTLQIMRGAAQYMMGRYMDARLSLSSVTLDQDPHAALWRGLTETELGDWPNARRNLAAAQRVLRFYPQDWRTRAQLSRAEAGLAIADLSTVNDALDQLPALLQGPDALSKEYYAALLLAGQGHVNEATARLRALESADYAPVAAS